MKTIISIEELAMFILAMFAFSQLELSWWWFIGLLFTPDLSMLGYALNSKIGAIVYNIFHHKALAIAVYLLGIYAKLNYLELAGIILFAHSSLDRLLGYGLKTYAGFKHTHLGLIGKN